MIKGAVSDLVCFLVPTSQRFVDIHAQKKLVPPAYSGHVLAALAVKAEKSLSGQFVNYSDESMSAYQPSK